MKAYWFEPKEGVLGFGDKRKPEVGVTHTIEAPIKLCHRGLHASVRAIDALKYARSSVVWEVELGGEIIKGDDKCVATERTYLRRIDASGILFQCACRFALSVAHLWDMPPVVKEFLETGNLDLRDAAWAAAREAANAARYAAMYTDWDAVTDAQNNLLEQLLKEAK